MAQYLLLIICNTLIHPCPPSSQLFSYRRSSCYRATPPPNRPSSKIINESIWKEGGVWGDHSNWGFGHVYPPYLPLKPFVVVDKSDCEDVFCHGTFYDDIPKIINSKKGRGGSFLSRAPLSTYTYDSIKNNSKAPKEEWRVMKFDHFSKETPHDIKTASKIRTEGPPCFQNWAHRSAPPVWRGEKRYPIFPREWWVYGLTKFQWNYHRDKALHLEAVQVFSPRKAVWQPALDTEK